MKTELTTPASWARDLELWRAWMHASGRPLSTVKIRTYHLRRFALFCGVDPFEATHDQMVEHLAGNGWAPATQRSVRASLRSFYGWAHAMGRARSNPAALLPSVATPVGHPRPADDESVLVGLASGEQRTRMMVALGSTVGLRASEIAAVHSDHVLRSTGGWSLTVLGKGRRTRTVPISSDLARTLRLAGGYLFPGKIDGHLSGAYVSKLVSAALPQGVTAHMLRHRFASRAYRNSGHNIRAVQMLLGHSSVATTQVYTAVDDDELRRAALSAA